MRFGPRLGRRLDWKLRFNFDAQEGLMRITTSPKVHAPIAGPKQEPSKDRPETSSLLKNLRQIEIPVDPRRSNNGGWASGPQSG